MFHTLARAQHWLDRLSNDKTYHHHSQRDATHIRLLIAQLDYVYQPTDDSTVHYAIIKLNMTQQQLQLPTWMKFAKCIVEVDAPTDELNDELNSRILMMIEHAHMDTLHEILNDISETPHAIHVDAAHIVRHTMPSNVIRRIGHLLPLQTTYDGLKRLHQYLEDIDFQDVPTVLVCDEVTPADRQRKALYIRPQHAHAFVDMIHHYYPNLVFHIIGHNSILTDNTSHSARPHMSRPQLSPTITWYSEHESNATTPQLHPAPPPHQPPPPQTISAERMINLLTGEGPKIQRKKPAATAPDSPAPSAASDVPPSNQTSPATSGSPGLEGFVHLYDQHFEAIPMEERTTVHVGRPLRHASARR
eukprot:6491159-Amphidinium_carterae.1